jgi:signal transduction histidine kinase
VRVGYGPGMVRTTWRQRLARGSPVLWDGSLAGLLLVITGADLTSADTMATVTAWVIAAALCAPLAMRRGSPLVVLAVVSGVTVMAAIAGAGGAAEPALALAIYTAAAHRPWRSVATVAVPLAVAGALPALLQTQAHDNWVEVLVALTAWVGFPLLLGRIVFNRRERIVRDRAAAAREAVSTERTRIARELHDVVAHAIGVMVVQAGAARTVVDRDPSAAKEAIARVEETGRAGLVEMRRLIGVLTDDEGSAPTAPQPGLGQLDLLLGTVRDAGLPVEVVRSGTERPLPPGSDLAAYRVIQESLTNVLKHAGPATARVRLTYLPEGLAIDVEDDGHGVRGEGTGHGLIGMRERVAMLGGRFETSEHDGGGFAVHAEIPLEDLS